MPIERYEKYAIPMKLRQDISKARKASKIMNNAVSAPRNLLDDANRLLCEVRKVANDDPAPDNAQDEFIGIGILSDLAVEIM